MAKLENRFIRIEDWKGNVYYPDSNSDSSTAGIISKEAGSNPGDDPYTEGEYVSDPEANGGKAIMITSGTARKVLYKASFTNIPFGKVSIGVRMKSNIYTGDVNLIEMNSYFRDSSGSTPVDTLLDTYNIAAKQFLYDKKYITLAHGIEYTGTATGAVSLVVELIVLPDTGATIWFDEMYVAMDIGSSYSGGGSKRDVYVEDTTVVVGD